MMKDYKEPEIRDLGTVTDLTKTGLTNPGGDAKGGSQPSNGN
jgi:hypothetical protein